MYILLYIIYFLVQNFNYNDNIHIYLVDILEVKFKYGKVVVKEARKDCILTNNCY